MVLNSNARNGSDSSEGKLTHFNEQGRARMVDISGKEVTVRTAVAVSKVTMNPSTLEAIREGRIGKGDVLAVAQIAGIQGAKNVRLDSDVPSAGTEWCGYSF